jgi:WD40 repeat protein
VTLGLDDTWPSDISISIHTTRTRSLSACGNWFATGGYRSSYAVYGVWDVKSVEGETHVHPCDTADCSVSHVHFYEQNSFLSLQTVCECGLVCLWNLSHSPPELMKETRLNPARAPLRWSDDGSRAIMGQWSEGPIVYGLWVRDVPQEYVELFHGARASWLFSPGSGKRLACAEHRILEVWNCSKVERKFAKEFKEILHDILFAPDANTILVMTTSIECIASDNGMPLWIMPREMSIQIAFFPCSQQFVIVDEKKAVVANVNDGSILSSRYGVEKIDSVLIEPNRGRVVMVHEDGILRWNPLDGTDVEELERTQICRNRLSSHISWEHEFFIETNQNTIVFACLSSSPSERSCGTYSILLSPDATRLAILTHDADIQIWDGVSGGQIMSYYALDFNSSSHLNMEFSLDSSKLLIWGFSWRSLILLDSRIGSIETFNGANIATATLLHSPSPNPILTIDENGLICIPTKDGAPDVISHLSFRPQHLGKLRISQKNSKLAIIHNGTLIIRDISANGREFQWPGGCTDMLFTQDSSHIVVLERVAHLIVVSHLSLPDLNITYVWTGVSYSDVELVPRYSSQAFELICGCSRRFHTIQAFDWRHGKSIVPGMLHQDPRRWVRYCPQRLLPRSQHLDDCAPLLQFSGNSVAWINAENHVFVMDTSLIVEYSYVKRRSSQNSVLTNSPVI